MGGAMNLDKCAITAKLQIKAHKDMGDNASVSDPSFEAAFQLLDALADGRGADYADLAVCTSSAIAASGNWDIALQAATDQTAFGDNLAYGIVKLIFVINTGSVNIEVGDHPTNAFGGWITPTTARTPIGPGGCLFIYRPDATGYPVTSGDILRIHNPSGSTAAAFKIAIVGEELDSSSSSSSTASSVSSSSSTSSSSSHSASSLSVSSSSSVSASASSVSASSVSASSRSASISSSSS